LLINNQGCRSKKQKSVSIMFCRLSSLPTIKRSSLECLKEKCESLQTRCCPVLGGYLILFIIAGTCEYFRIRKPPAPVCYETNQSQRTANSSNFRNLKELAVFWKNRQIYESLNSYVIFDSEVFKFSESWSYIRTGYLTIWEPWLWTLRTALTTSGVCTCFWRPANTSLVI
jgi:hypothetical protein